MNKIVKSTLSFLLIFVIVFQILLKFNVNTVDAQEENASNINIGDYIVLGKYYDEPIVWRCVDIDENGPLMLSDKILCFKSFDAKGNYGNYYRDKEGTNNWNDSALRHWLNSNGIVDWSNHISVPKADNVFNGYNPYDKELGFLTSFSEDELSLIKTVTQKTYINSLDTYKADGGTKEFDLEEGSFYNRLINVESQMNGSYFQYSSDSVFLLDPKQAEKVLINLGEDYLVASGTQSAINNDTSKFSSLGNPQKYWLRVARNWGMSYEIVNIIDTNKNVHSASSFSVWDGNRYLAIGVRPAFYLDTNSDSMNKVVIFNDERCAAELCVKDVFENPIPDAKIKYYENDEEICVKTDENGEVLLTLNLYQTYNIEISAKNFDTINNCLKPDNILYKHSVVLSYSDNYYENVDKPILIRVLDSSSQEPIENASIRINGMEKYTDNEGKVVVDGIQEGIYRMIATHSLYRDYEVDYHIDNNNKVFTVYMEKGDPDGFYISSSTLHEINGGNNYIDIRNKIVNITKYSDKDKNKEYDVFVNVNLKEGMELEEVVIAQPGGNYISSSTGVFEKKKLGEIFSNNSLKDIYIYAKTKDGQITAPLYYTLINIQTESCDADFELERTISLGTGFKLTLPDNCPVFGGQEINLGFADNLPVCMEVADGKAKVVLGTTFERDKYTGKFYASEYESYKKKIIDSKRAFRESDNNLYQRKLEKIVGCSKESFVTTSIKPTFEEGGYIELENIDGKWKITEAELMILGKIKYSYNSPFWIASIPCYYSVSGGFSLCWEGKYINVSPQEDLINSLENAFEGNIKGELSGSLELGTGIPKVVTAGMNGEAKLTFLHGIGRDYNKVNIDGSASIVASVLGNEIYRMNFLSGSILIYETGNENGLLKAVPTMSLDTVDSSKTVTPVSREYIDSGSDWIGGADLEINTFTSDIDSQEPNQSCYVLETNVYPYADTKLMEIDGKKILVWLKDNTNRNAINRSMLVYSVYDDENEVWLEPIAFLDDGKADFYPNVSNGYVVWEKIDKEFDENSNLNEISASGEIYLAKWNGNGFDFPVKITENELSDTLPVVCSKEDNVSVVWIENSENDLFGNNGTNYIFESHLDGNSFSAPRECVVADKAILDIDAVYLDDKIAITYTMESDNLLDTNDDWVVNLYYDENNIKITENEVLDSTPTFETINNTIGLFWIENGNLLYRPNVLCNETKTVFDEKEEGFDDKYMLMSDGNQMVLAWNAESKDSIEVKGAFYDGQKWSKPTVFSDAKANLSNMSGMICENDNILFAFVQIDKSADSYLCTMNVEPMSNISVDFAWTDYEKLFPGKEIIIYANITNSGYTNLSDISIDLLDGDDKISEIKLDYLGIGESTTVELKYLIPLVFSKKTLDIIASIENQQENNIYDNSVSVEVGQADLYVDVITNTNLGTKSLITASIKNIGNDKAENVVINLRNSKSDGECLESVSLGTLQSGESREVVFSVNFLPEEIKQLYVSAETKSDEYSYGNNCKYVVFKTFARNIEMSLKKNKLVFSKESEYDNFDVNIINKDDDEIDTELFSLSTSPEEEMISSSLQIESVEEKNSSYNIRIKCDIEKEIEEVFLFYNGVVVDRNCISYEIKKSEHISTTVYATKNELMTGFIPDINGNATNIGKLAFGNMSDGTTQQEWYILGKDNGVVGDNIIIFASSPIATSQVFNTSTSDIIIDDISLPDNRYLLKDTYTYTNGIVPIVVNANHYGISSLRAKLNSMADDTTFFSVAEQKLLNATTVTTIDTYNNLEYTTKDKLYSLCGDFDSGKHLWAGTNNDRLLSISSYWNSGNYFWLRSPMDNNCESSLVSYPGIYVNEKNVSIEAAVQPASNINLSTVIFASAVPTQLLNVNFGTISEGTAMKLRIDGNQENIGTSIYNAKNGLIFAQKDSDYAGVVTLVVQGTDSIGDTERNWYYSKKISNIEMVSASEIKASLDLSDIDLNSCKIWMETVKSDGLTYALQAVEGEEIRVIYYDGDIKKELVLLYEPTMKVGELKEIIESRTEICDYQLFFNDTKLNNEDTLQNYCIKDESAIELIQIITNIEVTDVDSPVGGNALDYDAVCESAGIKNTALTWSTADNDINESGKVIAFYSTEYFLNITLTANEGYAFDINSIVSAKINGNESVSKQIKENGRTLIISAEPFLTDKDKLISIVGPENITVANGTTYDNMNLPIEVDILTEGNTITKASILWNTTTPESGKYDPAILTEQTVTIKGVVICSDTIDVNGVELTTSITIVISAATPCWKQNTTGWWYDNGDGTYPKSEWKSIDGSWYYFNNSGYMATGWLKDGADWYYLKSTGAMATGWLKDGADWYYLESSGKMAANKWVDSVYYMKANGAMAVSEWVDGGRYYVDSNGKWVPNKTKAAWKKDNNGWWYDNGDGTYPKSTWKSIDGSWYYFNNTGYMVTGWLNDGGKWYYLESNGKMASSKWIDGTYYVKANGVMAADEWVDGNRYYVDANGRWVANKK